MSLEGTFLTALDVVVRVGLAAAFLDVVFLLALAFSLAARVACWRAAARTSGFCARSSLSFSSEAP